MFEMFDPDETAKLMDALTHGMENPTEEDAERLFEWAARARIAAGLLENMIGGSTEIVGFTEDGEPLFRLTEQGKASAENIIFGSPGN